MSVKAWEEKISIPTYRAGAPDRNPMFLEKRVYQGSSGAVYPYPVIDSVSDEKEDIFYNAVFLENDYLKIMILPELGGRIQMAYDKTNDYHFVYYNRVIKPALVGLTGPWISGGIEFNWPQHHRPGTFEEVDFSIESYSDGSVTVWVSEIEKMTHTKGMAGFTLYPDKAYLEIKGKVYNRTPLPQSFLWWANPAVSVNEHYQSVFPPDVNAVFDHGKRDVSSFPVATGTYYKVDYSPGTDISWYKNIPVPTSYMAVNSAYDFIGGYDHGRQAGILHVANHHVSPGKKQWTWGCGEFGKAWDRQLTDNDGPYFELMTGMFTDNQPDFGWIMPNEERSFRQYFMPYKNIGYVKNASIDAAVNLEIEGDQVRIRVYVTSARNNVCISLLHGEQEMFEAITDLSPVKTFEHILLMSEMTDLESLRLDVFDEEGRELVSYTPPRNTEAAVPEPARPLLQPGEIATNEELYLAGLHLEQYRHATFSPVAYYEEALRRDPSDYRNNNALGLWFLRHGKFEQATGYFCTAIATLANFNPNPYDGEPIYNLAVTLFFLGKYEEAYSLFYKASWNAAWQDNSFLFLARIDVMNKNYPLALEHVEKSIVRNYHGYQARHLKSAVLRKLNRLREAEAFSLSTLHIDPFDFGSGFELFLTLCAQGRADEAEQWLHELESRMRTEPHNYIEVGIDYARAGMYQEAISVLQRSAQKSRDRFTCYYISYFSVLANENEQALKHANKALECRSGDYFLNRLDDILMLRCITQINPRDHQAWYHLGNTWYDKRQYDEAIDAWEKSAELNSAFATVHRNLGIACFNRKADSSAALAHYRKAFELDNTDARILFEFDQLKKRLNHSLDDRYTLLRQHPDLVNMRDDLFIEWVTLHNLLGKHHEAASALARRKFHPWEGGEGKVSRQYVYSKMAVAREAYRRKECKLALELLQEARHYPDNLGEGKLHGAGENDIHFWLGCVYECLHEYERAKLYWEIASDGLTEPSPVVYYNDQQPDKIFYQALALSRLQRPVEAERKLNELVQYGRAHQHDKMKIDYFAVSLPNLLIFDDDLDRRNKEHCEYLVGLGMMGLGLTEEATMYFKSVLSMNPAHEGATIHLGLVKEEMISINSDL